MKIVSEYVDSSLLKTNNNQTCSKTVSQEFKPSVTLAEAMNALWMKHERFSQHATNFSSAKTLPS